MKNLAEALVKAQAAMINPVFDSTNPHFRSQYASLVSVREAVIPVLNKFGLSVIQLPVCLVNGDHMLAGCKNILLHISGESVESECLLPLEKRNAHGAGSCITYARRYSLMAIAGVVGDEDDDANSAVKAKITPAAGAIENVAPERMEYCKRIGETALEYLQDGQPQEGARAFYESTLDTEEKVYVWSTFFNSKEKTLLKKTWDSIKGVA